MASKRKKAAAPAFAPAPPKLVTEMFDCLTQCSRAQQLHLLSRLLQASPESVLQDLRAEAAKTGALIETKSRFQQCSHRVLDFVFSFLKVRDLLTAERVCGRWRCASRDSGAGWASALSGVSAKSRMLPFSGSFEWPAVQCDDRWLQLLLSRRLKPERLAAIQAARVPDESAVEVVAKLPSLRKLAIEFRYYWETREFAAVSGLQALRIDFPLSVTQGWACESSVTELTIGDLTDEDLEHLKRFPQLKALSFEMPEIDGDLPDDEDEGNVDLTPLPGVRTLAATNCRELTPYLADKFPNLEALQLWKAEKLDGLEDLGRLTVLHLYEIAPPFDLDLLAELTNLTELQAYPSKDEEHSPEFGEQMFKLLPSLSRLTQLSTCLSAKKQWDLTRFKLQHLALCKQPLHCLPLHSPLKTLPKLRTLSLTLSQPDWETGQLVNRVTRGSETPGYRSGTISSQHILACFRDSHLELLELYWGQFKVTAAQCKQLDELVNPVKSKAKPAKPKTAAVSKRNKPAARGRRKSKRSK